MPSSPQDNASFSSGRRWRIGLNVFVSILSALALIVMFNYLSARHFVRSDWSNYNPHRLSALTRHLLETMTNQVSIKVLFNKVDSLYSPVSALLNEYQLVNRRLQVDYIDYIRNPGAAQSIKEHYKLALPDEDLYRNLLIFDSVGKSPRIVYEKELYDLDISGLVAGSTKEIKRSTFKGELVFTSAILNVIDTKRCKAYFLRGHNELSIDDDDTGGFSKMGALFQQLNITTEKLTLGNGDIPSDCDLLVLAGPSHLFSSNEQKTLNRYLEQGGRLFLLLDRIGKTGLERVLDIWGVRVGNDLVFDFQSGSKSQSGVTVDHPMVVTNYLSASHPIVKHLLSDQLQIYLPRSICQLTGAKQEPDSARVSELLASSESSCAVMTISNEVAYPNPLIDKQGPISIAVAVEKGSVQGISADKAATRMVVVGDSLFLSNSMFDWSANRDFAVLAINWLLDRTQLMGGIAPRPIKEFQLVMTPYQMTATRWFLLAGMPGGVLLIGLAVWWRRRH